MFMLSQNSKAASISGNFALNRSFKNLTLAHGWCLDRPNIVSEDRPYYLVRRNIQNNSNLRFFNKLPESASTIHLSQKIWLPDFAENWCPKNCSE